MFVHASMETFCLAPGAFLNDINCLKTAIPIYTSSVHSQFEEPLKETRRTSINCSLYISSPNILIALH